MKRIVLLLFIINFLCRSITVSAQNDSANVKYPDSTSIKYIHFDLMQSVNNELLDHPLDYEINFFFYKFSNSNPLKIYNGNAGSFEKPFNITNFVSDDFFLMVPFQKNLILDDNSSNFIISEAPATNAFYSSGANNEQYFSLFHSQKIDSIISFTINYNIINAPGLYTNQRTSQSNFFGYILFAPKNNKYIAASGVIHNKIQQRENGGIGFASAFEDSVIYDRQFAPVNFISPERTYKDLSGFVKHYYRLTASESTFPLVLGHDFQIQTRKNVFSDLTPFLNPYDYFLLDSLVTLDSVYVFSLANNVSLSNFIPSDSLKPAFQYFINYQYQSTNVKQMNTNKAWFRNKINVGFNLNLPAHILLSSQLSYFIGNHNNQNYDAGVILAIKFPKSNFLNVAGLNLKNSQLDPLLIYSYYNSNHIYWNNVLKPQTQTKVSGFVDTKPLKLHVNYVLLSNYVCLGQNALPEQFEDNFGIVNTELTTVLTPGRFFIESVLAMNLLPEDSPVRLPEFYGLLRTGIQFPMFKNAMKVFFGLESIYFTKFYADSWSVVTGMFHLQDNTQIGDYIYPGVYLGLNIKRARIFVMLDNATAGLLDIDYYAMPAYPRYDRFFRWGVSWSFYY